FYHIELALSSTFFDFFQNLFRTRFAPVASRASSVPAFGRLSALFAPVSLRQLCYSITSFLHCQPLFSSFFMFGYFALFCTLVIDKRKESYPLVFHCDYIVYFNSLHHYFLYIRTYII
ncbi:MAG: hypothetical protein IIY89_09790, partial [Clostridia bacterium]|nr:hypothetical protein [Clostridia bacterium]